VFNQQLKVLSFVFASISLAACTNSVPAPVIDLSQSEKANSRSSLDGVPKVQFSTHRNKDALVHVVKPGETLFSIAWRYSLDYRVLAVNNKISANTIFPGQKLNLRNSETKPVGSLSEKPFRSENLLAAINNEVLNKKAKYKTSLVKGNKGSRKTYSVTSKSNHKKLASKSTRAKKAKTNPTKIALREQGSPVKQWIWPVNGKVVGRFSSQSNKNKGLDIVAKKGSPVRATAKGRVVYSGNGLRGYGQLVIIKHNDKFLSAYAHNDKIHVEENEVVKAGQRIAELGNTDSDKDKLHFEIRYKGKPVDPLNYLPKSGLM